MNGFVSFVAKNGGSCGVEESWSNFHLSVREGSFYGEGSFFLGQKALGGGLSDGLRLQVQQQLTTCAGTTWRAHKNPQVSHFELQITRAP